MGDVGIGEEGDVGDGIIVDEEIVLRQMSFHHFECVPTAVAKGSTFNVQAFKGKSPGTIDLPRLGSNTLNI